jgi:hypothetical protein
VNAVYNVCGIGYPLTLGKVPKGLGTA